MIDNRSKPEPPWDHLLIPRQDPKLFPVPLPTDLDNERMADVQEYSIKRNQSHRPEDSMKVSTRNNDLGIHVLAYKAESCQDSLFINCEKEWRKYSATGTDKGIDFIINGKTVGVRSTETQLAQPHYYLRDHETEKGFHNDVGILWEPGDRPDRMRGLGWFTQRMWDQYWRWCIFNTRIGPQKAYPLDRMFSIYPYLYRWLGIPEPAPDGVRFVLRKARTDV